MAAAAVGAVAGCRPTSGPQPSSAEAVPTPDASVAGPITSTTPIPSAVLPEAQTPSKERIVSQFGGLTPSYWGLEAPHVIQTLTASGISLTLDFCGGARGSGTDHAALTMLEKLELPATLFLNSRWIRSNPELTRELAAVPFFELANHGTGHLPLSVNGKSAYGIQGTRGSAEVYEEIMANDGLLAEITGRRPRFFRPGTAYLDDIAARICLELDVVPVGFSVNADGGATFPASVVADVVGKSQPGDVIISHGNQPHSGTAAGLAASVPKLRDRGFVFTTLLAGVPGSGNA